MYTEAKNSNYIDISLRMHVCFFSLACLCFFLYPLCVSLSLSLSFSFPRIYTFALSRSFVRSFVVSERYCDKYLSRRRTTLIHKKSKKPIDYLFFSSFDCLQADCTSIHSLPTSHLFEKKKDEHEAPLKYKTKRSRYSFTTSRLYFRSNGQLISVCCYAGT